METTNELNLIHELLQQHAPITLNQMDSIRLMNRVDRKFMTQLSLLPEILRETMQLYFVQENQNKRISPYATLYFDTEDLRMFTLHHNKKLTRQKIRLRSYLDSRLSFLEIKKKNNKGRTKKIRVKIDSLSSQVFEDDENCRFVSEQTPFESSCLIPQLENNFSRITLVNKDLTERLTMDFFIQFHNCCTHLNGSAENLVIIELKTDGNVDSPMLRILTDKGIRPVSISKYCLGTVLTNPNAKHNQFKRKLVYINKLTNACL